MNTLLNHQENCDILLNCLVMSEGVVFIFRKKIHVIIIYVY